MLTLERVRSEGRKLPKFIGEAAKFIGDVVGNGHIISVAPQNSLIAIISKFSDDAMKEYFAKMHSVPDSWCDCRKYYWEGYCWLRDVTDHEDLVKVLNDESDQVELFFVNKNSYDSIATHIFPISDKTYAEAHGV